MEGIASSVLSVLVIAQGRAWLLQLNPNLTGGSRAWYRLLLPRWGKGPATSMLSSGDRAARGMASVEVCGAQTC